MKLALAMLTPAQASQVILKHPGDEVRLFSPFGEIYKFRARSLRPSREDRSDAEVAL